ncbi:MAG TPA: hypothetical protein VI076_15855 [Actinopolymorphaceae bacterium]
MTTAARDDYILVTYPLWLRIAFWCGSPALGAGLGYVLQAIAGWVASLPAAPLQGFFELIASLPRPQVTLGALAVGAVAGAVFAVLVELDMLKVTVSGRSVRLARGGDVQEFARESVRSVFVDEKALVLLGTDGGELARTRCDLDTDRLAAAFRAHHFVWVETDPHDDSYRRWVEDAPDLPAGANAVLRARAKALEKGDTEDAEQLRVELAKLNVVVRDRRKRQFWRMREQRPGRMGPDVETAARADRDRGR